MKLKNRIKEEIKKINEKENNYLTTSWKSTKTNAELMVCYNNCVEMIEVNLEGVKESDVEGWLKVAELNPETDSYYNQQERRLYIGKDLEDLQNRNPIQIKEK